VEVVYYICEYNTKPNVANIVHVLENVNNSLNWSYFVMGYVFLTQSTLLSLIFLFFY